MGMTCVFSKAVDKNCIFLYDKGRKIREAA
jgi:hypothetical protein